MVDRLRTEVRQELLRENKIEPAPVPMPDPELDRYISTHIALNNVVKMHLSLCPQNPEGRRNLPDLFCACRKSFTCRFIHFVWANVIVCLISSQELMHPPDNSPMLLVPCGHSFWSVCNWTNIYLCDCICIAAIVVSRHKKSQDGGLVQFVAPRYCKMILVL